jgi:apolipoprotein N-acyltransferase
MVINADGALLTGYNKAHLVTGLESQFTPGNKIGLFQFSNLPAGVAICKDLDFPAYIRQYGEKSVHFLFVPAWDFVVDDWLHSRMAVLRAVENGCSEIRSARQGRLTISDFTGKVNFEASSSEGHAATLTGDVSLEKRNTLYSRFGDWFGFLNLIMAVFFLFFTGKKRRNETRV